MAQVIPFRAVRFTEKAGDMAALTCPPYDIISEQQRTAYLATNPNNIIRLELPRDGEDPYAVAGDVLRTWLAQGILAQDPTAAFYIYDITFAVGKEKQSFPAFRRKCIFAVDTDKITQSQRQFGKR